MKCSLILINNVEQFFCFNNVDVKRYKIEQYLLLYYIVPEKSMHFWT